MQLRGVRYRWKDPASQGGMNGIYPGFIAQEVEPVFPDWIGKDDRGYKTLTVIGFEALAVEALRELRQEKDRQLAERDEEIARHHHVMGDRAEEAEKILFNNIRTHTAEASADVLCLDVTVKHRGWQGPFVRPNRELGVFKD